jgi:hypothetical protein
MCSVGANCYYACTPELSPVSPWLHHRYKVRYYCCLLVGLVARPVFVTARITPTQAVSALAVVLLHLRIA